MTRALMPFTGICNMFLKKTIDTITNFVMDPVGLDW